MYGASPMPEAATDAGDGEAAVGPLSIQGYGMTEGAPATHSGPCDPYARVARSCASAGRARIVAEVKVVDPRDREVPRGRWARSSVRGPMVMKGYWNQPKLTAEALRGGWMHTGDAGYMDEDGFVYRRRPVEGHDHLGRRERLFGRSRERDLPASGGGDVRGDRRPQPSGGGSSVHAVVRAEGRRKR